MNPRSIIASFDCEEDLLNAAQAARERGWHMTDAYTPYAVHGLDQTLGLRRSRLPVACFLGGLCGVALALWFQFWTTAEDWPLDVGGRPWNSLPAFVPVAFEMMVLLGGLGLVLAWLIVCRLFPGKKAVLPAPQLTDNRFALVVTESDQQLDPAAMRRLFEDCSAVSIEECGSQ